MHPHKNAPFQASPFQTGEEVGFEVAAGTSLTVGESVGKNVGVCPSATDRERGKMKDTIECLVHCVQVQILYRLQQHTFPSITLPNWRCGGIE
jgi:hypothetical protein